MAKGLLGRPYAISDNPPSSFNCSSFVEYCMEKAGYSMKGTAASQAADGSYAKITSTSSLKKGDILCFDTDGDGMPDAWETANGLNPSNANDGKTYTIDSKGYYTNLEVYLNSLVEDIMKGGNADAENAIDEYYPQYSTPTGINGTNQSVALTKTTYTTLSGRNTSEADAQKGVFIVVEHFADGSKHAKKVVK